MRYPVSFIIICSWCAGTPAHAAVLEVPAHYPSIQQAIDAASPGDTVVIAPGLYRESITISGVTDLTLEGDGEVLLEPDSSAWFIVSITSSSGVTLRGLGLQNAAAGIELWECHDILLEQNTFQDVTWSIESVGGSYQITVRGSSFTGGTFGVHSLWDWPADSSMEPTFLVEENLFNGTWTGIFVDSSSSTVLRRNSFLDTQNIGIALNSWDGHEVYENLFEGGPLGVMLVEYDDEFYPPDFSDPSAPRLRRDGVIPNGTGRDSSIYNNIFYRTTVAGIYGYLTPAHDAVFQVRNNIFYQNAGTAIKGEQGSGEAGLTWDSQLAIAYNTFFGNGANFGGAVSSQGKGGSSRNLYRDPLFTDPAGGYFTLESGSSSIDTGTLDIDGDGAADLSGYAGRSRDRGIEERSRS